MILGVTPCRGRKQRNSQKKYPPGTAGKPLIAWTIKAAQESECLDRFVVSTEDPEIASVCSQWNAEELDRPAALALKYSNHPFCITGRPYKDRCRHGSAPPVHIPGSSSGLIDRCIR